MLYSDDNSLCSLYPFWFILSSLLLFHDSPLTDLEYQDSKLFINIKMTHGDTDVLSKLDFTKDLNLYPLIDQCELILFQGLFCMCRLLLCKLFVSIKLIKSEVCHLLNRRCADLLDRKVCRLARSKVFKLIGLILVSLIFRLDWVVIFMK